MLGANSSAGSHCARLHSVGSGPLTDTKAAHPSRCWFGNGVVGGEAHICGAIHTWGRAQCLETWPGSNPNTQTSRNTSPRKRWLLEWGVGIRSSCGNKRHTYFFPLFYIILRKAGLAHFYLTASCFVLFPPRLGKGVDRRKQPLFFNDSFSWEDVQLPVGAQALPRCKQEG